MLIDGSKTWRPVLSLTALLVVLCWPGWLGATELRMAGSLEHGWVVARPDSGQRWRVYHLPAVEGLETLHRAGVLDEAVSIDGLAAQDSVLWIFSGSLVRQREASWSELAGRWAYEERVGQPLPGRALSAVASDGGPVLLVRMASPIRPAAGSAVGGGREGDAGDRSALAVALGLPESALAEEGEVGLELDPAGPMEGALPEDASSEPAAGESVVEASAASLHLVRWRDSGWEATPILDAPAVAMSLVGLDPAGVIWVALGEPRVEALDLVGSGQATGPVASVAPLVETSEGFQLGRRDDLDGLLPSRGRVVMRGGRPALVRAEAGGDVLVASSGVDQQRLRLGDGSQGMALGVATTSFDGGLLAAWVSVWQEGRPSLVWSWEPSGRGTPRTGTLVEVPPAPPWSRPDYAITVVVWITSFMLLLLTLESRRRPLKMLGPPAVLAPLGVRAVAGLIDLVPCLALAMLITGVGGNELMAAWPGQPLAHTWGRVVPGLVAIILFVLSTGIAEAWTGQTAGKALMGLEVRSVEGGRPSLLQILTRNLLKSFDLVATLLLLLAIFGLRQRLGDMVARTVVVMRGPIKPERATEERGRRDGEG
ncbi:RDD family protein [Mucisphaera sp.]|uniref:RDD family protein n=1 Tax=Mucisphaera sp. TaxID=2913024 RepID=UPI003D14243D